MEKFYITTAINYANGNPHLGHAYEAIITDVIARYQRLQGKNVLFVTGSDEHGQKIADTAFKMNLSPIDLCNKSVQAFQELNLRLGISNDKYIRTTSDKHKDFARWFWNEVSKDIYLSEYKGWYNIREESYVTETFAKLNDYKDPVSGAALMLQSEPSYFFRLSKYKDQILRHLKVSPSYVQPENIRQDIIEKLENSDLADISISRSNLSWGIPVPDSNHVMYVWFDALTNYLSAINYKDSKEWPADIHIIGKDIVWFHAVIWTGMLLALKAELPKSIVCHGFINDAEGKKMSKSCGNVIDPTDILKDYDADTLRFYLFSHGGQIYDDLKFNMVQLTELYNTMLVSIFSNLVHRTLTLISKMENPTVSDNNCIFDKNLVAKTLQEYFETLDLSSALKQIFVYLSDINRYLTEQTPWNITNVQNRQIILSRILSSIYLLAHYLYPFMPVTIDKFLSLIGLPLVNFSSIDIPLQTRIQISNPEILFKRKGNNKYEKRIVKQDNI